MGILMASGITLDKILDMTWEQIQFSAMSVQKHKVKMIEMVMTPIAEGLGGKKSTKSKVSRKNKMQRKIKNLTPEEKAMRDQAREMRLYQQIQLAGLRIEDK